MSPEEFAHEFGPEFTEHPVIDPHPYGVSAKPVKTGLTPRGKAALTFGAAALATTGLLGYQHYTATAAENQAKTQELQYQQDLLELEKLKELNKANAAQAKTQAAADKTRQKQIAACVNDNKALVGDQMGATYRYSRVVEDCQAQYPATTNTSDMQAAASVTDASTGGGGSVNVGPGVLIGGAALAGVLVLGVRKGRRTTA